MNRPPLSIAGDATANLRPLRWQTTVAELLRVVYRMEMDRTALYRHFNEAGDLLYVGISLCAATRLSQHEKGAPWYDTIARVEVEWFDNRTEAARAERDAIRREKPLHNRIVADRLPIFDAVQYIASPGTSAAYLTTYLEDGTPEEFRAALDTVVRAQGVAQAARNVGLTRAGIYKALGTDGNPSFETVRALLASMGMRFSVTAEQA